VEPVKGRGMMVLNCLRGRGKKSSPFLLLVAEGKRDEAKSTGDSAWEVKGGLYLPAESQILRLVPFHSISRVDTVLLPARHPVFGEPCCWCASRCRVPGGERGTVPPKGVFLGGSHLLPTLSRLS